MPPIAGLHDIAPIWTRSKLTKATDAPIRAAAAAASVPAWPPPTTMMSKLCFTAAPLAHLFHVEHSFADAEAPEKSVEHVLDTGAAGDSVERLPRASQRLGGKQRIRGPGRLSHGLGRLDQNRAVPRIDRDLAFRGKKGSCVPNQEPNQIVQALARLRRNDDVGA